VEAIRPHSEADPAALLVTFLAAAGAMLGRSAHLRAGDTEHAPQVWPLIIGRTAGGMKGTSWAPIQRLVLRTDDRFGCRIGRGLSSGEGLIERVRDAEDERDGATFADGVQDKRLLIIESEFSAVLGKSRRDGNVLSETLRQAWDGGPLSTLTRKTSHLVATGAHIVVIGHITPTELRDKVRDADIAGGLMNRFLPVYSHRSKRLPSGSWTPEHVIDPLAAELTSVLERSTGARQIVRDDEAEEMWRDVYADLTPDNLPDGNLAAVIARAVPQVLRLSLIYALLDDYERDVTIGLPHLRAALAVWQYVQESARSVFSGVQGDRDLSKLTDAIDDASDGGLSRNEIGNLFGRHRTRDAVDELLRRLVATGRYVSVQEPTGGRPVTRYVSATARDKRVMRASGSEAGIASHFSLISGPIDESPLSDLTRSAELGRTDEALHSVAEEPS
jgi:hypothetical protein